MMYRILIGGRIFVRAACTDKTMSIARQKYRALARDGAFLTVEGSPLYALPGGAVRSLAYLAREFGEAMVISDEPPLPGKMGV